MAWRRIDVAVLAVAVVAELAAGIALGRHGFVSANVVVLVAFAAGFTLRSPIPAATFTLLAGFVLGVWLAGAFVLAPGGAVIGAASSIVVRRRPSLGRVMSRLTTGTHAARPLIPAWALIMAPLGAAGAFWLAEQFFPPGKTLGLSGSARHLVNGLCAVGLVLLAAGVVTWRARVAGVSRPHTAAWALVSVGMALFWALGIFVLVYVVSGPQGG